MANWKKTVLATAAIIGGGAVAASLTGSAAPPPPPVLNPCPPPPPQTMMAATQWWFTAATGWITCLITNMVWMFQRQKHLKKRDKKKKEDAWSGGDHCTDHEGNPLRLQQFSDMMREAGTSVV